MSAVALQRAGAAPARMSSDALPGSDVATMALTAHVEGHYQPRPKSHARPIQDGGPSKKLDGLARELGRQAARDFMSRGLSLLEIAAALALAALLMGLVLWLH